MAAQAAQAAQDFMPHEDVVSGIRRDIGQYELERDSRHACLELVHVDVAKALEGIGERLARRLLVFRGVLAPTA